MANAKASFRSGSSSEDIARSLSGRLDLDIRDGRLSRVDLWQAIAEIGRLLGSRRTVGAVENTTLRALTGTFDVENGLARTSDLRLEMADVSLGAIGSVNLVDQTVNMRLVAVLSKERSADVGGNRVGGYMTTALADREGRLVIPIVLTGSLSQPRFAPDLKRVAEMKARQTLTDSIGGSLGAWLKRLSRDEDRGRDEPPPDDSEADPPRKEKSTGEKLLDALRERTR